ncbi:tRNA (guanine-N1)-methyltransferase [Leptolyngbya sp. CCY15150]|uniref:tRNA (guanine-N1)-methyltransferase n=1 Tax=Leptolyngbya sp. CCY15150 TaxID=2767772 RepID=UPI0031B9E6C2
MNSSDRPGEPSFIKEGAACFQVGNAFFRPQTRVVRDLGVLMAALHRQQTGRLRVLDAMAGCGVRSLRYWQESGADWLWVNDGNPDIHPTLNANLQSLLEAGRGQVTQEEANRVFFTCHLKKDYYDLVDVDGFGAATPHLSTCLWATAIGGLIYLTSTDGRTATGHLPTQSLRFYAAYARSHPAAHEQGLRLLLGSLQQQAAARHLGIRPLFSLFTGETYRVMVRLLPKPMLTDQNYGFLGYCHGCGEYQTVSWRRLGRVSCQDCDRPPTLTGPLWLGSLHDPATLTDLIALADQWQWSDRAHLLRLMAAEATMPPYFYRLGDMGKQGQMDIPKRSHLIQALQAQGYRATATHIHAEAIKTDASLAICVAIARSITEPLPSPD